MFAGDLSDTLMKLIVKGQTHFMGEGLFEVKNKTGQTVFAVYNEGVRVYVDNGSKGIKGGFAIGGFNKTKDGVNQDYFIVNRDSVRVYLDTLALKTKKGGFAIGGFNQSKGRNEKEYLRVTRDSTRIYIKESGKEMQERAKDLTNQARINKQRGIGVEKNVHHPIGSKVSSGN